MNKPICPPMSPERKEQLRKSTINTVPKLFVLLMAMKSVCYCYNNTFESAPGNLVDVKKIEKNVT